jgi:adenylylsulfate kinase
VTGTVIFVSGLPSSGKSTFAERARARLAARGVAACLLDGDEVRGALVPPPGYDPEGRDRFYDTLGRLAALLARQGLVVLVAATAHRRAFRERARAQAERFLEVHVATPAAECARRDAKGLYAAQRAGAVSDLPGADLAYEPPADPAVVARGGQDEAALARLISLLPT